MSPAQAALLAIALATGLALPSRAQEAAPPEPRSEAPSEPEARYLYLGSRAEAEFRPGGRGLALGFDLEPAGALRLGRASLEAGLLSRSGENGAGTLAPFAGLSWGWPLRLHGALALLPSATLRVLGSEAEAAWGLGLALPLEFRLAGRQYLRPFARADYYPATGALEAGFGLGIRLEGGLAWARRGGGPLGRAAPPAPTDAPAQAAGPAPAGAAALDALGDATKATARAPAHAPIGRFRRDRAHRRLRALWRPRRPEGAGASG